VLWNLFALAGPGRTDGDHQAVHAQAFNVMSFHAGGTGARPGADGLSATAFPSGVKNVPIEVDEAVSPMVLWSPRSPPGTGRRRRVPRRPRPGVESRRARHRAFAISAYYDRIDHPRGAALAATAPPARSGSARQGVPQLGMQKDQVVVAGRRRSRAGCPRRRPPLVAEDVRQGFVCGRGGAARLRRRRATNRRPA